MAIIFIGGRAFRRTDPLRRYPDVILGIFGTLATKCSRRDLGVFAFNLNFVFALEITDVILFAGIDDEGYALGFPGICSFGE